MAYAKPRIGKDGKIRYTACYVDLRGHERSAGTYAAKKEARKKAHEAEVRVAEGRAGDPRGGGSGFAGT